MLCTLRSRVGSSSNAFRALFSSKTHYKDPNFPMDHEGRVTHLHLKNGELSPRILSVGDPERAERLAQFFDEPDKVFVQKSHRGFKTYTGKFNHVPLSIVATGMGKAMMDFLVREARAIVDGPMMIVRFGTCGSIDRHLPAGAIMVASQGSICVHRNYDAFLEQDPNPHHAYVTTRPVMPDHDLSVSLTRELRHVLPHNMVVEGMNATADSFYASQGRVGKHFVDENHSLIKEIRHKYPNCMTMEMETFKLFHLAHCARGSIRAAAAAIAVANRESGDVISTETLHQTEKKGGRAILQAMASATL